MDQPYDSRADTLAHIHRVRDFLGEFAAALIERGRVHDASKLGPEEKPAFDVITQRLKPFPYGSEEYRAALREFKPAIDHHNAANSHHPEHYPNGIAGMTLLDLVEMVCDWRAAAERGPDGPKGKPNLQVSVDRFKIEPQLARIIANTLAEHE